MELEIRVIYEAKIPVIFIPNYVCVMTRYTCFGLAQRRFLEC
jgi:hypothetical protein